jgi:hypothetical protein
LFASSRRHLDCCMSQLSTNDVRTAGEYENVSAHTFPISFPLQLSHIVKFVLTWKNTTFFFLFFILSCFSESMRKNQWSNFLQSCEGKPHVTPLITHSRQRKSRLWLNALGTELKWRYKLPQRGSAANRHILFSILFFNIISWKMWRIRNYVYMLWSQIQILFNISVVWEVT